MASNEDSVTMTTNIATDTNPKVETTDSTTKPSETSENKSNKENSKSSTENYQTPTARIKPKPLKLSDQHQQFIPQQQIMYPPPGTFHPQSVYFGLSPQAAIHPVSGGGDIINTDEVLEVMEHINRSVKSNQFSTTLAGKIFSLYGYLKRAGEVFEQNHKGEMNRVFVSLRQACCRDSGQLGTPCRLKIMELIELRAMGWRPNLAHSQYYLNRIHNNPHNIPELNELNGIGTGAGDMEQLPVSAPPFGTFPINPFAFNLPPTTAGNAPMASAADLVSTAAAAAAAATMSPSQPSYYLIPASHVGHTQAGIAFISPTAAATVLPPPPISPLVAAAAAAAHQQQQQRFHTPVSASLSQPTLTGIGINPSTSPKGLAKVAGKQTRPSKIPGKSQYRDDVVIRNADSGKIMGVKGRRVAIIEELSKTIISFQKVPQGVKERTLTITGPTEESIEQAKVLIEETIRRNISPMRAEGEGAIIMTRLGDGEDDEENEGNNGMEDAENEEGNEFSIEGEMLKLQCSDPALLEVAKQALSAYFRGKPQGHQALRRTVTDAASRDQAKKERRKSMPALDNQRLLSLKAKTQQLQLQSDEGNSEAIKEGENEEKSVANKPLTLTMMISPPIGKQKSSSTARSTPNLAATGLNKRALCMMKSMDTNTNDNVTKLSNAIETKFMADESGGGQVVVHEMKSRIMVRVVYTREFVLQCASSPFSSLTPSGLPWISRESPEILRPLPGKFDVVDYKRVCSELKQHQQPTY